MTKEKNKFLNFLQENPKEKLVLICYLWIVILVSIIQIIVLHFVLLKKEQVIPPKPVLALILVDASIVNKTQETYLTGYRVECHETDISNTAKTPDVDANLKFGNYLKFSYTISNNTNSEMLYEVDVIEDYQAKNLELSYSLNNAVEKPLLEDYIAGQISSNSTYVITFFVRISDNLFDADLSGKFSLNITYFADSEQI